MELFNVSPHILPIPSLFLTAGKLCCFFGGFLWPFAHTTEHRHQPETRINRTFDPTRPPQRRNNAGQIKTTSTHASGFSRPAGKAASLSKILDTVRE
jgi:hypothetical protein